jgi:hypothetical protein
MRKGHLAARNTLRRGALFRPPAVRGGALPAPLPARHPLLPALLFDPCRRIPSRCAICPAFTSPGAGSFSSVSWRVRDVSSCLFTARSESASGYPGSRHCMERRSLRSLLVPRECVPAHASSGPTVHPARTQKHRPRDQRPRNITERSAPCCALRGCEREASASISRIRLRRIASLRHTPENVRRPRTQAIEAKPEGVSRTPPPRHAGITERLVAHRTRRLSKPPQKPGTRAPESHTTAHIAHHVTASTPPHHGTARQRAQRAGSDRRQPTNRARSKAPA